MALSPVDAFLSWVAVNIDTYTLFIISLKTLQRLSAGSQVQHIQNLLVAAQVGL